MRIRNILWLSVAAGFAGGATSCQEGNVVEPDYSFRHWSKRVGLRTIEGCADLEQTLKDQMATRMEEDLEANLEYALDWVRNRDSYCYCWYGDGDAPPEGCDEYYRDWDDGDMMAGAGPPSPSASNGAEGGASQYSTTNTQVFGVDEADFVKNDGSFVYYVGGQEFQIYAAWPAANTHLLSSYTIEGIPTRMFVADNRAVIYSDVGSGQSCSYDGYGYVSLGSALLVTVLDITDRSNITLERTVRLNGAYVNSRRVGPAVHTVAIFPQMTDLRLETWPEDLNYWDCDSELTEQEVLAAFTALHQANVELIDAVNVLDFLPSAVDTDFTAGGQTVTDGLFVDCGNFYEPPNPGAPGFLSVISFNLGVDQGLGAATILGRSGEVYASPNNLYVAVTEWLNNDQDYYGGEQRTLVHKFAIDAIGAAPTYKASGDVAGRLLNQFAMDEHQGFLRIATTEGYLPSPDCSNNLFVLGDQVGSISAYCFAETPACELTARCLAEDCCDTQAYCHGQFGQDTRCVVREGVGICEPVHEMEGDCGAWSAEIGCVEPLAAPVLRTVGSLTGIAPTEDIRSVRFAGDRGFMVTFKKTDPLFAFDLSVPTAPRITGELKIPGYSTYMHFMDDDHLLTIGFDAEDQGSFAYFQGIMLQIFDVSDMAAPALTFKEIIGTRGTTSDATDDHMAFNYFPALDRLAIPMGICEDSGGGGSYGQTMTFNGLLIYRVTADEGFTLLGGVDHRDLATASEYDCSNWWTNSNSQVKRSIFMDDFVFSLSPEKLKVNALSALDVDLVSLSLPASEDTGSTCYDW